MPLSYSQHKRMADFLEQFVVLTLSSAEGFAFAGILMTTQTI